MSPLVRYERVVVMGRSPVLLRIESESDQFLVGIEVNSEADPVAPNGADMRRHVIGKDQVLRRTQLVVDRTYGTLVRAMDGAAS